MTNRVYRPLFMTYNTRASLNETGKTLEAKLKAKLDNGEIAGLPIPGVEGSGQFKTVNAFGYSMGGLAARVNACLSGRTSRMITMATPHHGAMGFLTDLLGVDTRSRLAIEVLKQFSPGTAQLFDYNDSVTTPEISGNPFLFELNRKECARPRNSIALVAGDDAVPLNAGDVIESWIDEAIERGVLPESARDIPEEVDRVLSLGSFLNAEPSDGVVPVTSARARTRGKRQVRAIGVTPKVVEPETKGFNHFNAGTSEFSITGFAQDDLVPSLSDWIVEDGEFRSEVPTSTDPGWFEGEFTIDFNLWHDGITGVLPVIYGRDANDEWHVLSGADPESLEPETSKVVTLCGNSRFQASRCASNDGPEDLIISRETIPVVVLGDPSTDIEAVQLLMIRLGANTQTVPPTPVGGFLIPPPSTP